MMRSDIGEEADRTEPGVVIPQMQAGPTDSFYPQIDGDFLRGFLRISVTEWLSGLLLEGQRLLAKGGPSEPDRGPSRELRESGPPPATQYQPLKRIRLTQGVAQTLFDEYAAHQATERGREEIGWVLLGRRGIDEVAIAATLPAGADRDAGEAHVMFNSVAQELALRIVRQADKRLVLVGVVHTHPGSLRHPSDGDYRGDIQWVGQLRGREGLFGIGTADGRFSHPDEEIHQPRASVQCRGKRSFCWYSLREGARNYHAIPVEMIPGPDLAADLRPVWTIVEDHALRLGRLARQLQKIAFDVAAGPDPTLGIAIPLAEPESALRVALTKSEVRYFVVKGETVKAAELPETRVDRGVYRLLADLAGG